MRLRVGKNSVPVEIFSKYVIDEITFPIEGLDGRFVCRMCETDPEVFRQIFIKEEYDHPIFPAKAMTIVDAGANVGYSVLYFKRKYPDARIIAIEPDPRNFAMLHRNCGHLPGVSLIQAALWDSCTRLQLSFTGANDRQFGAWGVRTVEMDSSVEKPDSTEAVDVPELMRRFDLKEIDIFKIDIEGAEKAVFSNKNNAWYQAVNLFALETHERFAVGSDTAVKNALTLNDWEYARKGENQFFKTKVQASQQTTG